MEFHEWTAFAVASLAATAVSYYVYAKSVSSWETEPHAFSWFVWGFASSVIAAIQWTSWAWFLWAANMTAVAVFCLGISAYSAKHGMSPSLADKACLAVGVAASTLWAFTGNAATAVVLLIIADVAGFVPTFSKAWKVPEKENGTAYAYAAAGYAFSIWAMDSVSFETAGFVVQTAFFNVALAAAIAMRKRNSPVLKPAVATTDA